MSEDVKSCCATLYESDMARMLLGDSFHPGGLALTRRLGELLGLKPGIRVLDVASGKGESALFLAKTFGCEVVGLDFGALNVEQSTAALAESLVKAGHVVFELEPRDSPDAWEGRPFLGNWVTNERADLIGRNLAAMRAHDIVAAIDVLSSRPDVDPASIRGYGRGVKGLWMLMAAAVDPRLKRVWLDRTPWRYEYALEAPLAGFLFDALIPGLALHWDVPDFVTVAGENRVFWTDPTAWMYRIVYPGAADVRHRYVGQPDTDFFEEFLR